MSNSPIAVFFSYAHKDESLRDELVTHLKLLQRQGVITTWHDRKIMPSADWKGEIDTQLNSAQLILLLISSDFLASDYCYDIEMTRALERHAKGEARVIPIMVRPCDFAGSPFSNLQGLPKDFKPITQWTDRDAAWTDVAQGIRRVAESLRANPAASIPSALSSNLSAPLPSPSSPSTNLSASGKGVVIGGKNTGTIITGDVQGHLHIGDKGAATQLITILFLAADPTNEARLRLGQELREVQEKLQLSRERDRFKLESRHSVRPHDISQALLDVSPSIVHFSGHGASSGALYFENLTGQAQPVGPAALAALFEQFASQVQCVLLNACYSATQAQAIAQHIPYVIGMNRDIGDDAAMAFAIGFYQALGAGRKMEDAYKLGRTQIMLQGIPEHLTPVLHKKGDAR